MACDLGTATVTCRHMPACAQKRRACATRRMSDLGQSRRSEGALMTSDLPPTSDILRVRRQVSYVERPLRQVLFKTMAQRERCGHMSGVFVRSKTAGLDEVRDTSG